MAKTKDRGRGARLHPQDPAPNVPQPTPGHAPHLEPTVDSRPRLGSGDDSWATVLKDMMREAPKTGLTLLAGLVMTMVIVSVNAITYAVSVVAGRDPTTTPGGVPLAWLVRVFLELVIR